MDEQVIAIEHEIFGQTLEELLPNIDPTSCWAPGEGAGGQRVVV